MSMLKNGGSAVDAVEIAIMMLEDSEMTNAGYGSNLNLEGTVECDATVVNHLGRSGAVGAVGREYLFSSPEPICKVNYSVLTTWCRGQEPHLPCAGHP